jgi:hypothetical protein
LNGLRFCVTIQGCGVQANASAAHKTDFELPIEIKRDSNQDLWSSLREQLIVTVR